MKEDEFDCDECGLPIIGDTCPCQDPKPEVKGPIKI